MDIPVDYDTYGLRLPEGCSDKGAAPLLNALFTLRSVPVLTGAQLGKLRTAAHAKYIAGGCQRLWLQDQCADSERELKVALEVLHNCLQEGAEEQAEQERLRINQWLGSQVQLTDPLNANFVSDHS